MWRWVFVAAVVILGVGVRIAIGVVDRGPPDVAPPVGFTADVRQPPAVGNWRATGRTTSTAGYFGSRDVGETIVRRWTTTRRCTSGRCAFLMTRELADGERQRSPLTPQADGWHATFDKTLPCKVVHGEQLTWNQRSSFVLRFTHGGRRAEARQVNLSYAKDCGYGTSRSDWTAVVSAAATTRPTGNDGSVPRDRGHVNGIGERAMAASVGRAARADVAMIRAQVAAAVGRSVQLRLHRDAICRSRVNTARGTGAPFECIVAAVDSEEAERFVIQILVAAIEGRCWRAVAVAVKGADGRWVDYDKTSVERVLGRAPLRGCA